MTTNHELEKWGMFRALMGDELEIKVHHQGFLLVYSLWSYLIIYEI